MFEHLDDPAGGTTPPPAAAQRRGRELIAHRRRTRLAVGSAAVATTAGMTAVAAFGLPGGRAGAVTAAASDSPTASDSPGATVPSSAAASPPVAAPASSPVPNPDTTAPPTTKPPTTEACQAEAARLRTSTEPDAYEPWAGQGVIAWKHPAGPLKSLVVDVACGPFDPAGVPAGEGPVKKVTILNSVHYVIGDPATGHLEHAWTSDNGTTVTVEATFTPTSDFAGIDDELGRFANSLID